MNPVEVYACELTKIHKSGAATAEISFYPAIKNLLNTVGATLRPKVHCVMQIKSRGAGFPDGGLFTDDSRTALHQIFPATPPDRGVIEVKGIKQNVEEVASSDQVRKYVEEYGYVLITTLREFAIVGRESQGRPKMYEKYCLEEEADFWIEVEKPKEFRRKHGDRLTEFLKRALLVAVPLKNPVDVARFLASYAREARSCIESSKLADLAQLRAELETALGIQFDPQRGDRFFRSTLVQTLFYAIFAAWVFWHHENPTRSDLFDWRTATFYLGVPVLQELFSKISLPYHLAPLGLMDLLNRAGEMLNRVERQEFFSRFDTGQTVQYFYEPFLEAFDSQLRRELGVWYTPPEIVRYMVARVDAVLREELDVADGLADPNVYVLDPCTGTGAYLVETLCMIEKTLQRSGNSDALLGQDVKKAALRRILGFELLPAPFVIAHLQIGLLLQRLNAPLGENERVGVYLTNALTGWTSASSGAQPVQQQLSGFSILEKERDAAEHIKRDVPIIVVLGNPPYSGYAGIARIDEERDLSLAYRTTQSARKPKGQGLNDLYVRFFRMAERQIVERGKRGIVCFISNYSWLSGLSYTGMRERYLKVFDQIWIDNLHGDRIISEYAPDGRTSETIFAMDKYSSGIKVGTAITIMVKKGSDKQSGHAEVLYRDVDQARASERRAALIDSLKTASFRDLYIPITPIENLGFPFKPHGTENPLYFTWASLPDLLKFSFPGVKTSRDDALIDIDRDRLIERMKKYFDPEITDDEIGKVVPSLMKRTARFDPVTTRRYLQQRGFLDLHVKRYCYRPFDVRWIYWEPETELLDRKRSEYERHVFDGNVWIEARQRQPMESFDRGYVVSVLADNFGNGLSSFFPLYLSNDLFNSDKKNDTSDRGKSRQFNLSEYAQNYLKSIEALDQSDALFYHIISILHSPLYRTENAAALRHDWSRIPLPATREILLRSAELGRRVAQLLDSEYPVTGVTVGKIDEPIQLIAVLSTNSRSGQINPQAGDLDVTAGWGYVGSNGVVVPSKGRIVERSVQNGEINPSLGSDKTTFDVYLNERVYWRNIPKHVWNYTISGYQVLKKWLSYRESTVLKRGIEVDEAREVTAIARRIAALLLMSDKLDENYRSVKQSNNRPE